MSQGGPTSGYIFQKTTTHTELNKEKCSVDHLIRHCNGPYLLFLQFSSSNRDPWLRNDRRDCPQPTHWSLPWAIAMIFHCVQHPPWRDAVSRPHRLSALFLNPDTAHVTSHAFVEGIRKREFKVNCSWPPLEPPLWLVAAVMVNCV